MRGELVGDARENWVIPAERVARVLLVAVLVLDGLRRLALGLLEEDRLLAGAAVHAGVQVADEQDEALGPLVGRRGVEERRRVAAEAAVEQHVPQVVARERAELGVGRAQDAPVLGL